MRALVIVAAALLPAAAAYADINQPSDYAKDREHAISKLTPALRDRCISDFSARHTEVKPTGQLVYNDTISRAVYTNFYWDESKRGVAFTMPLVNEKSGDLACFYALTGEGLRFQQSQQIDRPF